MKTVQLLFKEIDIDPIDGLYLLFTRKINLFVIEINITHEESRVRAIKSKYKIIFVLLIVSVGLCYPTFLVLFYFRHLCHVLH